MSSPRRSSTASLGSFGVVFVAPLAVVFGLPHLVAVPPSTTYGHFSQYVKPAVPVGFSAAYVPRERLDHHRTLSAFGLPDRANTDPSPPRPVPADRPWSSDIRLQPDEPNSFAAQADPAARRAAHAEQPPQQREPAVDTSRGPLRQVSFHTAGNGASDRATVQTHQPVTAGTLPGPVAGIDRPGDVLLGDRRSGDGPRPYRRMGPLGTSLGLEPVTTELTWPQAVRELKRLGIEDFHLERGQHPGDEPKSNYRFAAEAYHPLQAVAQVLRQIRAVHRQHDAEPPRP